MTKAEREALRVQAVYPGYTGSKLYGVRHPDFGDEIIVCAPDQDCALVSAAKVWKQRWTSYHFYAYCMVRRME